MVKKIIKGTLLTLGLVLAAALIILLFYLPNYLFDNDAVELQDGEGDEIVLMSTNVRFYNPLDFFKQSWFYRADLIVDDINAVKPDIIGFQEATFLHYDYLKAAMVGYGSEIAYRDDFILSEGCPIFYRTDKYERVDGGSFWLSETPEVMSKSWGSMHYRICVYVILREKESGREFVVFNTHLDHKSEEARIKGIRVVLDKIREFGDLTAFLMGDLNAEPDSETIFSTVDDFDDAALIAESADEGATYHEWGKSPDEERIDYIMISRGDAEVSEYRVVDNCHDGVYSSDHSSIYIKATLK